LIDLEIIATRIGGIGGLQHLLELVQKVS
jgi:hypothetical protein